MGGPQSDPLAFVGGVLDRAGERRTDAEWLAQARRDPAARAVVIGAGGAQAELVALRDDEQPIAFLGLQDGAPLFAVERDGEELTTLRDHAGSGLASERLALLAYAAGLTNWSRGTRFCPRCGEETQAREGGHMLACGNDHQHHPRTDPVVIMLVVDDERDRAILGRQPIWPPGRYSTLAGFVEPGESLEAAVAREIREEAGVEVGAVRYVASQPWPFPVSLMLGFHADFASGEPSTVDAELEDVRWYSREELAAACARDVAFDADAGDVDGVILPPSFAISRQLIERWVTAPPR